MIGEQLGQIMVRKKIISEDQLDKALERQKKKKDKYLGEILLEMGVSQEQINKALYVYNKRTPIGQILVDWGAITPEGLRIALEKQKSVTAKNLSYKPLGMLLVELGFINYQTYLNVLSKHFNMPIVHLKYFSVNKGLQKKIGEEYTLANRIIVLRDDAKKLEVALAEPSVFIQEELQKAIPAGKTIVFKLADPLEVMTLLRSSYDPYAMSGFA